MADEVFDLRSDTLSQPTEEMQKAMAEAETGDDCFNEDKTVRKLEEHCAGLFGKQAALLLPSGTMSNQVALRVLVDRGNEVICDASYHLNFFEAAQTADISGVSVNAVDSKDGLLDVATLQHAIDARARWTDTYATPALVWHENTINGRGGKVIPLPLLQRVFEWSRAASLSVYIDGARIPNAAVASCVSPQQYGRTATALSICFAKGLGAPMGSALMGSNDFIKEARRLRKWYGGGLHQSGVIAAGALYGLKNHWPRLAEDHENARHFAQCLINTGAVDVTVPDSNIVIFDIGRLPVEPGRFIALAERKGVKLLVWRGSQIRAVFCLNVSSSQAIVATARVASLIEELSLRSAYMGHWTAGAMVAHV